MIDHHITIDHLNRHSLNRVIEQFIHPDIRAITTHLKQQDISLVYEQFNLSEPVSIPGKLAVILYNRFKKFGGNSQKGLCVITPLLQDSDVMNLEKFIIEIAHYNDFDPEFIDWVEHSNNFSNVFIN